MDYIPQLEAIFNPLNRPTKIKVISPSGFIDPNLVDKAVAVLESWGCAVSVGAFAKAVYGRFAGTDLQRLSDLQTALDDPHIDMVLCSRGGYGLMRIMDQVNFELFRKNPKLVLGFSDITLLHAAIQNEGFVSVHAPMVKHIATVDAEDTSLLLLKSILQGVTPSYTLHADPLNKPGTAKGILIGGNLSVLFALRGSRFEPPFHDRILFIEDINEEPYHIDRMIQNWRMSGVLAQLEGLVVGEFTHCNEDKLMNRSIKQLILDACSAYSFPICFGMPTGHGAVNYPLLLGHPTTIEVNSDHSHLRFIETPPAKLPSILVP